MYINRNHYSVHSYTYIWSNKEIIIAKYRWCKTDPMLCSTAREMENIMYTKYFVTSTNG